MTKAMLLWDGGGANDSPPRGTSSSRRRPFVPEPPPGAVAADAEGGGRVGRLAAIFDGGCGWGSAVGRTPRPLVVVVVVVG